MKQTYIVIIILAAVIIGGYWLYNSYTKIETVRVAAANVPDARLIFTIVKDKKIDIKHGLNLDMIWAEPGEVERKIIDRADGVEIGPINALSLIGTNAQGKQLRIIAPFFSSNLDFIVKKDSPYRTLQDLKGKTIAIRPKVTAGYKALAVAVAVSGFQLERDFRLIFGTVPESVKFLTSGEADATIATAGVAVPLLASGKYRAVIGLDKEWQKFAGASMPFVEYAAHLDWIQQNPKKAKQFRKIILEAASVIIQKPQIIRDYADVLKFKNEEEWKLAERVMPRSYVTTWNLSAYRFFLQKASELGFVKVVPKDEDIFAP